MSIQTVCLFLYYFRWFVIDIYHINASRQVRYVDAVRICSTEQFRSGYIEYAYDVDRFIRSYVKNILHRVRIDGNIRRVFRLVYTVCALFGTCKTGNLGIIEIIYDSPIL